MYENQTQEAIQARVLNRVSSSLDKREGSVIQTAVAPVCAELAQIYINLDSMMDESFADTASRDYLIRRAAERGLSPIPASAAIVKGTFNLNDIPLGSRFLCGDYIYDAFEKVSNGVYKLRCETLGTAPNGTTGEFVSMDTISGLETATLTEVLITGRDEEDTETFRERYWASFETKAFGGNRADYIAFAMDIDGVGAVKVHRASVISGDENSHGGNVRLVILDSDMEIPSTSLVDLVKETIDPSGSDGEGLGTAPMFHHVYVEGATATIVNINLSITFDTGYSWATLENDIKAAISGYLKTLVNAWANDTTGLIVRKTHIQSAVLAVEGVLDVVVNSINGVDANLVLDVDAIPVRGVITCS